ncbi:hypothetical protein C4orf21 [Beauveria bassiana ARSEF 2860]|uniref:5'-3' DNA helicase ZGRF1-like N-terminal domain-containing protein n=1 Tax=Beauveria bassiana (strain ARSEF 2860) TaxID=655819 RepID=J5JF21_BEAB2|nr:hypothetical protein C4orf21 [Beauveria bassiana ARSEF 2860]EJP64423.1 hypothetical protein C4orf21 [Beauveria bassiana ARSEF 2860]
MSYAVAKPQASPSAANDGPPSTATVYDFICLFTHDLRRKQKRWQDGKLKYHSFNKKVVVYDDRGHFVGDSHWDQEGDLAPGDELSLDRGMALVQVEDCTGEKQQDLTELLDKRAREVEKRRQIAATKTRPAPRSSAAAAGGAQPQPQRPHLPLSSLVQSPGPIGRAAISAHSPFEARQQKLHQNQRPTADAQPTVAERPPLAKKRRTSPSPPSKAGFARNLFGTTLNLSSCPGPELMAAKARALRQRMLSQAAASSTPQEEREEEQEEQEEVAEEQSLVPSSPIFVQDDAENTPSRPAKKLRSTLQPITRHPIASARSVFREAEEAGNRDAEVLICDEEPDQEEDAPKRQRTDIRKPERQTATIRPATQDTASEDETITLEDSFTGRTKKKELLQLQQPRQTKDRPHELQKKKSLAIGRPPFPDAVLDEADVVEEAPRQNKMQEAPHHKKKTRQKVPEESPVIARPEPKSKEPRTTLRLRSRQKRGLLMIREPSVPVPEPPASRDGDVDDRNANTPSPEPPASVPQRIRSASPEEVTIPSSAPPVDDPPEAAPAERDPTPAPLESSSEDELPQTSKRRAKKRKTYSPPPEPAVSEKAPKKRLQRRKATKSTIYENEMSEAEEEPRPRRRLVAKRREEPDTEPEEDEEEESQLPKRRAAKRRKEADFEEQDGEAADDKEIPKVQGPRIAKLPRKGIRSREIIGYFPQGIETLIPNAFDSASFRVGGPPAPVVSSEVPTTAAKAEAAPKSANVSPYSPAPAEFLLVEEKPTVTSPAVTEVSPAALTEETATAAVSPPEPAQSEAIAVVATPPKTIQIEPVSRPRVTVEALVAVVPSDSSSEVVVPTTTEANPTKLELFSAPEMALTEIPKEPETNAPDVASSSESEKKLDVVLEAAATVPVLPVAESMSSGSEANHSGKPRIANPASRGKKAARREDAAGLAPQVIVPFEPVVQPVARMISTRAGGAGMRARIAAVGPMALGPVAPTAAGVPGVAKKAASMPGFTSASGGTWSRHAHDLLGMNRPERRR